MMRTRDNEPDPRPLRMDERPGRFADRFRNSFMPLDRTIDRAFVKLSDKINGLSA